MTLRTPPTKQSVLALREAVALLGHYNGTPLNEVILDLYERTGVVTPPPPPPPPTSSTLTNEDFDDGGNVGDAIATTNTSMSFITGSGSVTLSDGQVRTGGLSALVDGTTQHYGTTEWPLHSQHLRSPYWYHDRNASDNAWLWGVRDQTAAAWAFQWGIDSTGHLIGRASGSGAATVTSAGTLPVGAWYRFTATPAGSSVVVRAFTGSTEDSTTASDAVATITITITATGFTNDTFGLHETIAGTGSAVGNLWNIDWEDGTDGAVPSNATTGGVMSGSSSLTFSNTNADSGLVLAVSNGTARHTVKLTHPSSGKHMSRIWMYYGSAPSAVTDYMIEFLAGDGTTIAAQFMVTAAGLFRIRDSNSGTGGGADETAAASTSTPHVLWFELDGAANSTCRIFKGASINSTNPADAWDTLTCTLTATNFSGGRLGRVGALASGTGAVTKWGDWRADDTTVPVGTSAVGIRGWADRDRTDTATMPTPLPKLVTPPTSGITTVPSTGALFGGTFAATGVNGSTSALGLSQWKTAVGGRDPQIASIYRSGVFNQFSATERAFFDPAGGAHRVPMIHWKINSGGANWAQVAAGARDADIDGFCNVIAQYNRRILMVLPHHEPEDDVGSMGTAANYVAMGQRFVTRVRAFFGGNPPMDFVEQYVGYSSWAQNGAGDGFEDLYVGDEFVDIIGYDPYTHSATRDTLDELVNENIAGVSGWPGCYDHFAEYHPTKPHMLCEFGVDMAAGTGMTVAQATSIINNWRTQASSFPLLKLWAYWNSLTGNGSYQIQNSGREAAAAAMETLVDSSYFIQDMTVYP